MKIVSFTIFSTFVHGASAIYVCNDDFDCYPNGACGPDLKCFCNSGYVGEQCELECPLKCQNGGQCLTKDEHGGLEVEFSCDCPPTHIGGLCDDLVQADEPCPLECTNGGQCIATNGQFLCSCRPGYVGVLCHLHSSGGGASLIESEPQKNLQGRVIGVVVAVMSALASLVVVTRLMLRRRKNSTSKTPPLSKNASSVKVDALDDGSLPRII